VPGGLRRHLHKHHEPGHFFSFSHMTNCNGCYISNDYTAYDGVR
jgi:hypothetical protein